MAYEFIVSEKRGSIGVITLNRPKALNALCEQMVKELAEQVEAFNADEEVGAIIITGNEKSFAAGADVTEMVGKTFSDVYLYDNFQKNWNIISDARKPIIAAVAGYALGVGCELALMCDFIIAADNAKFGQPEITLGMIPGFGGTQRLTRIIGKAKTMEMILTGRSLSADEAEKAGIVSRVVPLAELINDTVRTAERIAVMSRPAVIAAKESIKNALEAPLNEGIKFEHRLFNACFATEDHTEGLNAFIEKRQPQFGNR